MTKLDNRGKDLEQPNMRRERQSLTMGAQMALRQMGGRYTVQDKIGTGGMAIVYRGLDEVLGRTVAIKTMLPQYANDPSFAARFKQEAQAAAALQSPYIVSVYDWGKDDDTYYIIMEYLRGTDLKSGIRKHGALDCRKVAQIGSQIAQALSVAHRHDIIHRDIKPQNIMVQPDGNVKVMDFGIARAKNSHLTTDNSVLGTAHYVSPEQTQGMDLGPTTDIYSLGIVMYEAATGRVPFDGDDAISVALKQVNEPPMPPSQVDARVDPALESIILKCMQKSPEDRFQSAEELYHVLRDYLAGRLQSIAQATSVIQPATPANHTGRTSRAELQRRRSETPRNLGGTTGRFNPRSAREAELERKHHRHFIAGVIVVIIVILGIFAAAFFVANHQRTHEVPELVGLTREEAIKKISELPYFTVAAPKEGFSSEYPAGTIYDQNPDAGVMAREGTEIILVVSKGDEPAKDVTVPDLTGLTPQEANNSLNQVALQYKQGDAVFSDTVESGKIAGQTPAPNTTAKAGDVVVYNLSKGPEEVDIPEVIGLTREEAEAALNQAGLVPQVATSESDTYGAGIVCDQSETGKTKRGSTITITVSSGLSQVSIPYVIGRSEASAYTALANAGFGVSTISITSPELAGTVVGQSEYGQAPIGTVIQLEVSNGYGGKQTSDSSDTSNSSSNSSSSTDESSSSTSSSTEEDIESASSTDTSSTTDQTSTD